MLTVLGLLTVLLFGGLGYLKYRSLQRLKIEKAALAGLQAAPSPTLSSAHITVSVNDAGEVTLDGSVPSIGDSSSATSLVANVPGVSHVNNRLQVVPQVQPPKMTTAPETADSINNRCVGFMDDGKYPEAIDCFTKAANDPNNKSARELLETARRAQKTEEQLLKRRQ